MRFREQCWLSAPTDRRRVNLPSSSQGEWILKNYAQLWDRFSREEPQSPAVLSPPVKLPVIPEGCVLGVVSLGDQAGPTSTPEMSSGPVDLRGKRGRRTSWDSPSESSSTESVLPETAFPTQVTDPAMTSTPRPRRKKKRRKGASRPSSLPVPEPATASAVPEPATASAVPESAVVSAAERAAADSAAEAVLQSVSASQKMPVLVAAETMSEYLKRLVQILEVPVMSCPESKSAAPQSAAVSAAPQSAAVSAAPQSAAVSAAPQSAAVSAAPQSAAVSAAPQSAAVSAAPQSAADDDLPDSVMGSVNTEPSSGSSVFVSVPPSPAVSPALSPVVSPPVSPVKLPTVSPRSSPHASPVKSPRIPCPQSSSRRPKTPSPPIHPGLPPKDFVFPPPPLPWLLFLILHPNPVIVYSCLPLVLFVMFCWFVSLSQSVMSRV
ncbi:hypothetical protein PO909_012982 [Leuciscus waleckii]